MRVLTLCLFLFGFGVAAVRGVPRPVVIIHGLDNSSRSMDLVVEKISRAFPGIQVFNLEIGDGRWDSLFLGLDEQVEIVCEEVAKHDALSKGFNLLGYSQGAIIARGYIERCNEPAVHNFVSWVGPHGGTFGLPRENPDAWWVKLLEPYWGPGMYKWEIQDLLSIAQFWRDPFNLPLYKTKSLFLASLNNAVPETRNETYRRNFASLNALSLVRSTNEDPTQKILFPELSTHFATFAANSTSIVPMEKTTLYIEDWIGLKKLHQAGKVRSTQNGPLFAVCSTRSPLLFFFGRRDVFLAANRAYLHSLC
jgi:palmitoyl-protein thioesterase